MIRSYLTVALRSLLRNKAFSLINIFGLGIGLSVCLIIFQYVSYELSFDKFNTKLDRIYRVTNDRFQNGKLIQHGTIMYPTIGPTMAKDFPEIENYTRLMPGGTMNVVIGDKNFRGDQCHFADEHFFELFDYEILAGDRAACLKERRSIVITESLATKYFGIPDGNYVTAIGKTLYFGLDKNPYKVTAVMRDVPENSHLGFHALVAYSSLYGPEDMSADNSWTWSDMRHYLLLKPGTDPKALEAKFPEFSDRYFQGDKVSGSVEKFYLQPLADAHLYSDYEYDVARRSSGRAVWAMLLVAAFILTIAWINYINLTTSRAMDRAKEVGLRKVMGAVKSQLVRQFILESVIVSSVAFVVAVVITTLAQGSFNNLIGGNLSWSKVFAELDIVTMAIFVVVMIAGMLLAGFYPAFVLSGYSPVTVLKGKFRNSSGGQFMRKALVVFQFTASAALITGTIIVSRQLNFMNTADLGLRIKDVLVVRAPELTEWDSTFIQRVENYKQALLQVNGVTMASTSGRLPGDRLGRSFGIRLRDQGADTRYTLSVQNVDHSWFETYGVELKAGRLFTPLDHKYNWDEINSAIINENAVKLLGLPDNESAVGREIQWGTRGDQPRYYTIVGVINNFHQESLRVPMEPMIFRPTYSSYATTSVTFTTGDRQKLITDVESVFKEFFPGNAFQYVFLEDQYNNQYRGDNSFGKVISVFTVLGIMISCLGLIGLSSYTAAQRTKEIGIRKVLGASIGSIVTLLSVEFIRLVVIATLLALPIAWFAMQSWLQGYAYRADITVFIFIIPLVLVIVIAAVTISFQVVKAAMASPANTLKYE